MSVRPAIADVRHAYQRLTAPGNANSSLPGIPRASNDFKPGFESEPPYIVKDTGAASIAENTDDIANVVNSDIEADSGVIDVID